jgi:capsular polysaccharide biosynthesis protein
MFKIKNIYKFFIYEIFKIIYGKVLIKKKIDVLVNQSRDILFNKKNLNYQTHIIKDARIYTNYVNNVAVICKNNLYKKTSFEGINSKKKNFKFPDVIKKGTPKFKKKFKGTVLSLVQGASGSNYFHWMFDILPKIFICSKNISLSNINYLYLPEINILQKQTLKLLNIKSKIINSKKFRHISADKIITIDHPWYKGGYFSKYSMNIPSWIVFWLRNKFLKKKKKFKCNKRIYIDRSDSKFMHSQIINNNETYKLLQKYNFKKYKIANFSFFRQIYLFWNSEFIISAHGAALTNLTFCKPRTKVIEIRNKKNFGRYFERISKINKLNYSLIKTKKITSPSGDILVPLNRLENLIINKI